MQTSLIYNISFAVLTILAFALSIISLLAYSRSKKGKLLIVSIAFILFFVKGLWLTYSLFNVPKENWHPFLIPIAILDCIILVLLYISILKG